MRYDKGDLDGAIQDFTKATNSTRSLPQRSTAAAMRATPRATLAPFRLHQGSRTRPEGCRGVQQPRQCAPRQGRPRCHSDFAKSTNSTEGRGVHQPRPWRRAKGDLDGALQTSPRTNLTRSMLGRSPTVAMRAVTRNDLDGALQTTPRRSNPDPKACYVQQRGSVRGAKA